MMSSSPHECLASGVLPLHAHMLSTHTSLMPKHTTFIPETDWSDISEYIHVLGRLCLHSCGSKLSEYSYTDTVLNNMEIVNNACSFSVI